MSRPFRFKQFTIHQDRAPMKVGTDGVLLGAWAGKGVPKNILDIGTGTGLIALMLAQRFPTALIFALEPNEEAAKDAITNFESSPFAERLKLETVKIQEFKSDVQFDLIVSNPPFFTDSLISAETGRTEARHNLSLSPGDLARSASFLSDAGKFSVIYPLDTYALFKTELKEMGLSEIRKTEVKPTPSKPAHRILGEFGKKSRACENSELIIEKYGRHKYSEEYIALTKDFYLFENLSL
jgi:tRNA1Val (adenine37-N6)-methyltransferase